MRVQVIKEIACCERNSAVTLLTLHTDVSEDEHHLVLVIFSEVLPEFYDDRLEIFVNVMPIEISSAKGALTNTTGHIGAKT